jgi:hypothetical protein
VKSASLSRRRTVLGLAIGSWFAPPSLFAAPGTPALRAELERVYISWLQAMRSSDVAAFARQTSRYRLACLRNEVVSWHQPWPAAVFKGILKAPDIARLTFIDASASGDAARLVYFGHVDFEVGDSGVTPENPLIIRFLREEGTWKFDWIQYVNLGKNDTRRRNVAGGDRAWLSEPDFALAEKYPDLPKACRTPYLVASLAIMARAAKVTIDINQGTHRITTEDSDGGGIITGGLQKGMNLVTITPIPMARGAEAIPLIKLAISTRTNDPRKPSRRLWTWSPPATPWAESYQSSVFVKSLAAQ